MNESHDAREIVRRRYAELAVAAPAGDVCCGPGDACVGLRSAGRWVRGRRRLFWEYRKAGWRRE